MARVTECQAAVRAILFGGYDQATDICLNFDLLNVVFP
jgi:hypothetical protein